MDIFIILSEDIRKKIKPGRENHEKELTLYKLA